MKVPYNETLTTAAFIALGFNPAAEIIGHMGIGHDGLIGEAVKFAAVLSQWASAEERDFPGVLDYEVSEAFGEWYGAYVRVKQQLPPDEIAVRELRSMFDAFMAQV